jgi:hypothetical protein
MIKRDAQGCQVEPKNIDRRALKTQESVEDVTIHVWSSRRNLTCPTLPQALPWLPALLDKGQVMVRYYGLYANAHRGKVKKASLNPSTLRMAEEDI